jgi:hypothetical protein
MRVNTIEYWRSLAQAHEAEVKERDVTISELHADLDRANDELVALRQSKIVHAQDGDLLVMRWPADSGHDGEVAAEALAVALKRAKLDVPVVLLDSTSELEALDADTLRAHGWVRAQ